jgi:hypothetical protein
MKRNVFRTVNVKFQSNCMQFVSHVMKQHVSIQIENLRRLQYFTVTGSAPAAGSAQLCHNYIIGKRKKAFKQFLFYMQ